MAFKTMVTELLWFLRGDTNIKYLVDNGCNIWNGDAYKKYHEAFPETEMLSQEQFINLIKTDDEFAKKWGDLGPIYGKQWRDWDGRQERDGSYDMSLDQMANLIFQLKRNPDSRRLMVNAWNVGELSEMTLPPCHYGFQVYTRLTTREEKIVNPGKYRAISLMWNQRSVDTFLGLPFNIASYALLTMMMAQVCNLEVGDFVHTLGDAHIYTNHFEQTELQLSRDTKALPKMKINPEVKSIFDFTIDDFELVDYEFHPHIKGKVAI